MINNAEGSLARQELDRFCKEHSRATKLSLVAAQEYAAARCALLNGLPAGVTFGAQAIEKFLKAWLLYQNPQMENKVLMYDLGHDLIKLIAAVRDISPSQKFPQHFDDVFKKFNWHYKARYPENVGGFHHVDTSEITDLDEVVIFLNENMPCPRNAKYRTGLCSLITFSLGLAKTTPPWEYWINKENGSLAPLIPKINADYYKVMAELFPANPELHA